MEYSMPRKVSFFNKIIFFQNSIGVVFIYDITSQTSFDEIKNYWFTQISESAPENIVKALVANKYDLSDKEN